VVTRVAARSRLLDPAADSALVIRQHENVPGAAQALVGGHDSVLSQRQPFRSVHRERLPHPRDQRPDASLVARQIAEQKIVGAIHQRLTTVCLEKGHRTLCQADARRIAAHEQEGDAALHQSAKQRHRGRRHFAGAGPGVVERDDRRLSRRQRAQLGRQRLYRRARAHQGTRSPAAELRHQCRNENQQRQQHAPLLAQAARPIGHHLNATLRERSALGGDPPEEFGGAQLGRRGGGITRHRASPVQQRGIER